MGLDRRSNRTRFIAYTPEFKQLVRDSLERGDSHGHFTAVRKLVDANYSMLLKGKVVRDPELGVVISPRTTGSVKGKITL